MFWTEEARLALSTISPQKSNSQIKFSIHMENKCVSTCRSGALLKQTCTAVKLKCLLRSSLLSFMRNQFA